MMGKSLFYSQKLRLYIQLASFTVAMGLIALIILGYKYAIHALCPYATICFGLSKSSLLGLGTTLFGLTVAVGIGILIFTMFFGRKFCGYLCPLGTFQEALFSLRSRKYRKSHRFSYLYEKKFARLKYFILLATSLLSIFGVAYVFIRVCPFYALSMLPRLALPGLGLLLVITATGFFMERFWCRFLCPYAALMNIFEALGKLFGIRRSKIHRNLERCVDCGLCMLYCPMNLNIALDEYVHDTDCIHCLVCAAKCPKPGTFACEKETD